jgi:type I restriction-modification system DNA methylase subunit
MTLSNTKPVMWLCVKMCLAFYLNQKVRVMNPDEIIIRLETLVEVINPETFIYELLAIYEIPKSSITRLKSGEQNESKEANEIILKNKLYFKSLPSGTDLHARITEESQNIRIKKLKIRFLIVTDFETLLAIDTKTKKTLDIPLKALPDHHSFFLPWMGKEATVIHNENPADIKASEKMALLYDEICIVNKQVWDLSTKEHRHYLNVFLARLLFCFFAEDTEIFPTEGMFTHAIELHTQEDASNLPDFLEQLFKRLSTQSDDDFPAYLKAFPYANGGLFEKAFPLPLLSKKARRLMTECGALDWAEINPDIFGSMIQAVVRNEARNNAKNGKASGGNTEHYTSVPNIMKVINPLFLDDLKTDLEKAKGNLNKLKALHKRLQAIKIFDPACGSGNFLIIAYKELRELEKDIFKEINALETQQQIPIPQIKLTQFYGIELDDFAHEIAMLALWLAEHQMNVAFKDEFGAVPPPLPLSKGGNIVQGNATRLDWLKVCPKAKDDEVYVLGNPPYCNYSDRTKEQNEDMDVTLAELGNVKRLDYISCWFKKATNYIEYSKAVYAFVTTNSLCQGEQVPLLWPYILKNGQAISFCYRNIKWSNNAKSNAGVTCHVIGISHTNENSRKIYTEGHYKVVKQISPYLMPNVSQIVQPSKMPLSNLPEIALGSSPIDSGHLILSQQEFENLILKEPQSKNFIKKYIGGEDFIDGISRYCLWIEDNFLDEAIKIESIRERIAKCKSAREKGGRDAKKAAAEPHRFFYRKYQQADSLVFPMTSTEKRSYLTVGFVDSNTVVSNGAFVLYHPEPWVFAVVSSKLHNVWVRAVAGRMRTDIRYSSGLCYNTFPFPEITEAQKEVLSRHTRNVIREREQHSEKTIAELYDLDKMPEDLRRIHKDLDEEVEMCYGLGRPFLHDEERLAHLFKLYEEMIAKEQTPLFATQKKQRKGKRNA